MRREHPVYLVNPRVKSAVNAALHLRRPLLLTGAAGSGKSSLADLVARELGLGPVLKWHISSKTTVTDGLYSYESLDRLRASQAGDDAAPELFVKLGPLGTALACGSTRVVLIDEIDKGDIDLPGDLLHTLEGGMFEIPVLSRRRGEDGTGDDYEVSGWDDSGCLVSRDGTVKCTPENFPVIVLTSNGERVFAPPFLRRCVRIDIGVPDEAALRDIVTAHLKEAHDFEEDDPVLSDRDGELIGQFAGRLKAAEQLAINQILELIHLVKGFQLSTEEFELLCDLLTSELNKP
jgi:MoxR-like ATPase